MYFSVKKVQIRTPNPEPIHQGPCWSLAACAQGQLWRGLVGDLCPSAQALALGFCWSWTADLLCWLAGLALLFWLGVVGWCCVGGALPCPSPSPASPALAQPLLLLLSDTVFSILLAFFFLLFWKLVLLCPQENRTATLTTSDHLNEIVFRLLLTKDYLNDSQMWKVSIKLPLFYNTETYQVMLLKL